MGYASNLASSKRTVEFVKSKMTIGAANRWSEVALSLGSSLLCVNAIRSVDFGISSSSGIPSEILKDAAKAEHVGCGNCGEQAALAFVYLAQNLKVSPVDFMSRTNADHAFVVVGRKRDSDESDYLTWGDECVVCDPWDGKAFPASQMAKEAYKGADFAAESVFRVE